MPVPLRTVTLESKIDGFALTALHADPVGERKGGVVVLQEIFGLDEYVQADVQRWARLGYEVYAPSLFDRQAPGWTAAHDPDGLAEGFRYAQANGTDNPTYDAETCVDELVKRGAAFVVGYCYGGWVSWLCACKIDMLAAAACYYGGRIAQDAAYKPLCPVVMHFGAEDPHIPASQIDIIRQHQPEIPVWVYEGAGHGFNNLGGAAHHHASAELARSRTLDLFEANGALPR